MSAVAKPFGELVVDLSQHRPGFVVTGGTTKGPYKNHGSAQFVGLRTHLWGSMSISRKIDLGQLWLAYLEGQVRMSARMMLMFGPSPDNGWFY